MINFLKAWAVSLLVDAVFYGVLWLVDAPEMVVVGGVVGVFIAGIIYSLAYASIIYDNNNHFRWLI